jgi:outer membrane protein assembly factor BamE
MKHFPRFVAPLASVALTLIIAGCSLSSTPFLYRQQIEQGNIATKERLEQLKIGMTPQQVRFVMGSPSFIDPFRPQQWNYFFKIADSNATYYEHSVSLVFENDKLIEIIGTPAATDQISELLRTAPN